MTELRIQNPTADQLGEYDTADLYQFLGELERFRYELADVEKRVMDALDIAEEADRRAREDA